MTSTYPFYSRSITGFMVVVLASVALLTAGCGAGAKVRTSNDLKAIGLMYHNYHNENAKGPAKVDDLKKFSDVSPEAYQALVNGKYVFIYGVSMNDMMDNGTSNTVIAYEKEAPTKGGYVLFGDGSVRELSAAEFNRQPKGQPKQKQ